MKILVVRLVAFGLLLGLGSNSLGAMAASHQLPDKNASTVFHLRREAATVAPNGLSPAQIKAAYKLPASGGSGTIAIVDAYADPTLAADLATFSKQYGLAACTTANGCLTLHPMSPFVTSNAGWALETSLDVEWAHAIAPTAKIMVVETRSSSLTDLLGGVDYARGQSNVAAVSMSWAAGEFSSESQYDSHFVSPTGAVFFAASGDSGHAVNWPAVSSNVVSVGGTTLTLSTTGAVTSETAWNGSGGGLSAYESEPTFQTGYKIASDTTTKRAVPDVSYDADPASGVAVYDSTRYNGQKGWFQVGGTSAGAPQWAAIYTLGHSATNAKLYADAAASNSANLLRDIVSGTNGNCATFCTAGKGYDYVTGLGSPLVTSF